MLLGEVSTGLDVDATPGEGGENDVLVLSKRQKNTKTGGFGFPQHLIVAIYYCYCFAFAFFFHFTHPIFNINGWTMGAIEVCGCFLLRFLVGPASLLNLCSLSARF